MSATERLRDLPQHSAMMADLRQIATLPAWLEAVARPEQVCNVLAQAIPEFVSGALSLHGCTITRLRLRDPQSRWSGIYQLSVAEPDSDQRRVVPLQGTLIPPGQAEPEDNGSTIAFGTARWQQYIPALRMVFQVLPPDTGLATLPELTNPETARALLERSLRASAPAYRDLRIQSCIPKVLRYHPGLRCTIGYHLTYAADLAAGQDWPTFIIVKTYEDNRGQTTYTNMRVLWTSPFASGGGVSIAEPLAFLPELNVLVQGPVREEQTLRELIRSALGTRTPEAMEQFEDAMGKTAVGLAALHRSRVQAGAAFTWTDELAEVRAELTRLVIPIPQLANSGMALLARLEVLAAAHPPDPPVPTHGAFHCAQVLLDHDQIGFIDFDEFCQAEPAMDLGRFIATTKDVGLSISPKEARHATAPPLDLDRMIFLEQICDRFLAQYERLNPVSRQRVALWEALHLFTLVLHCWVRVKPLRLNTILGVLERTLSRVAQTTV
jgi:hypothetical protein